MTFTANEVTSSKPLTVNGELTASSLTLGAVAVTASAEQINKLTTVTATDTELNILDGVTGVSATNINQLSGVTSNINTFMGDVHRKADVYTKTAADAKFLAASDTNTITEVGALNAGSITDGFGSIDVGADSIKSGSLEVGNIKVGADTIGHGADTDLITLANNSVTVSGTTTTTGLVTTTLTLGNTVISATGDHINKLATVTATDAELNILSGVTADKDEINLLDGATAGTAVASKAVVYDANKGISADSLTSSGTLSVTTSATVGDISIADGSISSSGGSGIDFSDNNLTTGNITGNNFVINGNLTVNGTQTTVNTENVIVNDPLMVLSSSAASGVADSGLLINRGTDSNVAFIWDESQDHFAIINTTATDNSANDLSITSYSDLKVNKLLVGTEELTDSSLQSLNDIVGATAGQLAASKAIVVDSDKHINELKTTDLYLGASGAAVKVTASADEINFLSGIGAGEINNGAIVVYGTQGELNTSKLQLNGSAVDADASELNILQGATGISSNNLNHLSNLTENVQAGLTARYTTTAADAKFGLKAGSTSITSVGPLTVGSIASGFGHIDIGNKDITAGSATIDDIVIDGAKIGHTDDLDLMVLSNGKVTVGGTVDLTTLHISGTPINATADDYNKLANVTATASELNILDGVTDVTKDNINHLSNVTYDINTKFGTKLDTSTASETYAPKAGTNITSTGPLSVGSIVAGFGDITLESTKTITAGKVSVDDVVINNSNIGHSSNTELITLAQSSVSINSATSVTGKLSASSLNLGGTDISATAGDFNKLASVTAEASELNILSGVTGVTSTNINQLANVTYNIHTKFGNKLDSSVASSTYAPIAGGDSVVGTGTLVNGAIGNGFGPLTWQKI